MHIFRFTCDSVQLTHCIKSMLLRSVSDLTYLSYLNDHSHTLTVHSRSTISEDTLRSDLGKLFKEMIDDEKSRRVDSDIVRSTLTVLRVCVLNSGRVKRCNMYCDDIDKTLMRNEISTMLDTIKVEKMP